MHNRLFGALLAFCLIAQTLFLTAQCPTFTTNATITNCSPGGATCDVCAGDQITFSATGQNFPVNGCVDFYYSTSPVFNPTTQGTLLGCAPTTGVTANPCSDCPEVLTINVNACGSPEQANEFMILWSGGGFAASDLTVDFDGANNGADPNNADIGGGCAWQTPSASLMAGLSASCTGGNLVAVGPGGVVPPNSVVLVFTSSATNTFYDIGTACSAGGTAYVLQNACQRTIGAFTDNASGTRTYAIDFGCCSDAVTYTPSLNSGSDGDFVIPAFLPSPLAYINLSCGSGIPTVPTGTPPPPETVTFDYNVDAALCNGGPYYVIGVVDPLASGCPPVQTSVTSFDVLCPSPVITPVPICADGNPFDLNTLLDATYTGTWSSSTHPSAVSSSGTLNTTGLTGPVVVSFNPTPCGTQTSAALTVTTGPTASIGPVPPICQNATISLGITFTGTGPFTFDLLENGSLSNSYTSNNNTYNISVTPSGTTTYTIVNLQDASCSGTGDSETINIVPAPTASMALTGPSSICSGESTTLEISFTGSAPFTFQYELDGATQAAINTNSNPHILTVSPTATAIYELVSVSAGGCPGTASGMETITVTPSPTAALQSGNTTVCNGTNVDLNINFTGTGPWAFDYLDNGGVVNSITTSSDPYTLSLNLPVGNHNITIDNLTAAGGTCAGNAVGLYTIDVAETPTASMTGSETICAGGNAIVVVDFTGSGPWTFEYDDGLILETVTTNDNPHVLVLSPTMTTTYTLNSVTASGCSGNANGTYTVSVADAPQAQISTGSTTICQGDAATVQVDFVGTGPFTFDYTINGTFGGNITTNLNPYDLVVTPIGTGSQVVELENLTNAANCTGTVSGFYDINVVTAPEAVLSGNQTLCGGGNADLQVDFFGTAPFTFVYAVNGVNQAPITTSDNPYTLVITASATSTFTLTSMSSSSCNGTTQGTATVTVTAGASATLQSGSSSLCAGDPLNLNVSLTGGGPYDLIYAINGMNQPVVQTSNNTVTLNPTALSSGLNTITLVSVENGGTCTGGVSGSYTATMLPQAEATLSGDETLCAPGTVNFPVNFVGNPPYQFVYAVNGTNQPAITTNENPYALSVNASAASTYTMVSAEADGCTATATGQATVAFSSNFTATLTGDQNYCFGSGVPANLTVTFAGDAPPYTFVYRENGVIQTPITTNNNPHTLPVLPSTGTTYELVAASTPNCQGTVSGTARVFIFTPPTASIASGNTSQCGAGANSAEINFTGTGPFTINYSLNGAAQTPITTTDDPYILPLNITQNTTLTLDGVESPGCTGVVQNDQAIYTLNPTLLFNNFDVVCNQAAGTYTVEVTLSGGTPPYSIVFGNGSFTGNDFVSAPIPLADTYAIGLTDASNCDTLDFTGMANCNCISEAGTALLDTIRSCVNDPSVTATFNNDFVTDADDIVRYVLHTNSGNALGQILSTTTTPTFSFIPGSMFPNTVYYISRAVGDAFPNGQLNNSDPCLSVSVGVPVIWYEAPTISLMGDYNICVDESQSLTFNFTGNAPFVYTYSVNSGVPQNGPTATASSQTFNTTLSASATYTPLTVSDAYCDGTALGMATITVHEEPNITNVEVVCDAPSQTYIVEFDVNFDSLSSVTIVGSLGGDYDTLTGHFTSAPVPWGNPYNATVVDQLWLCGADSIMGMPDCNCTTDAGTMSQTPLSLCAVDTAFVSSAMGAVLEDNDTLIYILSSSPNGPLFNTLMANSEPVFTFNAGILNPNTTYYILAVAGDTSNTASYGIDLGDPCLSIADGTPVSWQDPITAQMQDNVQICQGDTAELTITFGGNGPFVLEFLKDGILQTPITSNLSNYTLQVSPNLSANYSPISVTGAGGCEGTVSGGAAVSVLLPPNLINLEQICDFTNQTYQVTFDITNGAAPNPTYAVLGLTGTLTDTTFLSDPIPVTQGFDLTVENPIGCEAVLAGVSQCACGTEAGTIETGPFTECTSELIQFAHNGDFALDSNDLLRYIVFTDLNDPTGSIVLVSDIPQVQFSAALTAGTTYYTAAIAGSDDGSGNVEWNDPCFSISNISELRFTNAPTATLAGSETVCPGDTVLFQIQMTGTPPFLLTYEQNGMPVTVSPFANNFNIIFRGVEQDQSVNLIGISDASGCMGTASGAATITVLEVPEAKIFGEESICLGGTATLQISLSNAAQADISVSDGINPPVDYFGISDGFTFDVSPTQPTTYTITYFDVPGATCQGESGESATVDIQPLQIDAIVRDFNGFQISCAGASDGFVEWVPTGGGPDFQYQWNNGFNLSSASGLAAGQYSVTITDQDGCAAEASVDLTEPSPLLFDFATRNPDCSNLADSTGAIILEMASGGAAPYSFSLENDTVSLNTLPAVWNDLAPDNYVLIATDANGCTSTDTVSIFDPNNLEVYFQDSLLTISFGDSLNLEAFTTQPGPFDSIAWNTPGVISFPDDLILNIAPQQTTLVQVFVQDSSGCIATAQMTIAVVEEDRIYIPNILKPNSFDGNHIVTVYGGPEVDEVLTFDIYDRWGNLVFQETGFQAGDLTKGWNGLFNGRDVQTGVYVYIATVRYIDGRVQTFKGDITVAY